MVTDNKGYRGLLKERDVMRVKIPLTAKPKRMSPMSSSYHPTTLERKSPGSWLKAESICSSCETVMGCRAWSLLTHY